ncbi:binding-protein-dependent transport systems inner membrane component [Thermobaculum terrenum ATCC BAA-798]|mgnify:CR=1 FL=1|uniref:Binding-protein-dependent transport systems inner membrane component n=1 Tax=Thermobaculum terrenum (strain ATCC BAA-798 / CCMEE 7001 / YNP1) TaxID=525904 RepID=D1CFP2_THET1|nr:carbohydrate ABC transporter permease [Thermobaculum terrenum]ACZ41748.1 binding-protein-dependent transport systems inner membrane component [Thermobaculum terrenum ATCC BAA-798]
MAVVGGREIAIETAIRRRRSARRIFLESLGKLALYAILSAGAVIFAAPFAWMVVASTQSLDNMFRYPPSWIPINPSLDNYIRFLQAENLGRWVFNSAYVSISVTALQLFFNSLSAYTYAKRRFPGRDVLFAIGLATMMIPGWVTLIPSYLILKHIPLFGGNNLLGQGGHGWLDSYWGLIAPGVVSTFGIFLLRQYMKTIPDELLEAAKIDGASHWRIYWQIVLPLCRPALAAHAIFTFSYTWDDFFWPLIIISSDQLQTLPLGLALFVIKNRTVWDLVMAGSVLATLPVLLMFLLFQRQFIQGITLTGLK